MYTPREQSKPPRFEVSADSCHEQRGASPSCTPDLGSVPSGAEPTQSPQPTPGATPLRSYKPSAEELLDQSEVLAEEANREHPNPRDNAAYRVTLCRVSAAIHSPKAEERCVAAYRAGAQLKSGCERDRIEAASIASLSGVNSVLAMQMLGKM